jgi:hypothetical protein
MNLALSFKDWGGEFKHGHYLTGVLMMYNCQICNKEVFSSRRNFEQVFCGAECIRKDIIQRHACCSKAELAACVCVYYFKCPEHGERHIGSHD